MRKDSGNFSVLIGVAILFSVALSMGGIAFSFYRGEVQEAREEAAETIEDSTSLGQVERETETVIVPVEEPEGGSQGIDSFAEGIPTGTYSNPPTTITSGGSSYDSSSSDLSANSFGSSVESNRLNQQQSLTDSFPDYTSPSSSNNFGNSEDNSLIQPLDNSEFLETPTTNSSDSESLYFNDSEF